MKTCKDLQIKHCPACNFYGQTRTCWINSLKREFGRMSEKEQFENMLHYSKDDIIGEMFYVLEMTKEYYPTQYEKFSKLRILI
jgi:hypothetical protein